MTIDSISELTYRNIVDTGNWSCGITNGQSIEFIWKLKSLEKNNYTFSMVFNKRDGFTTITKVSYTCTKLFEGYIKNLKDLEDIIRLCRLIEL